MITHVLVNDADEILKRVDAAKEFRTGAPPVLKGKGMKWLPFVDEPKADYDEDTHTYGGPVETVTATEVTRSIPIRVLTTGELQDHKFQKIEATDRLITRIIEDIMVAIAQGDTLTRDTFPAPLWAKINKRRALRGQEDV